MMKGSSGVFFWRRVMLFRSNINVCLTCFADKKYLFVPQNSEGGGATFEVKTKKYKTVHIHGLLSFGPIVFGNNVFCAHIIKACICPQNNRHVYFFFL